MAESPPPPPTMEAEKPHDTSPSTIEAGNPPPSKHLRLIRWLTIPEIEERGIQRVLPSDSNPIPAPLTYIQPFLFWFSINLAAVNITLGMLGPLLFSLSFTDSSLCAVFGSILGSSAVAYISTFGPESGVRTMVFARFTMGWWPAKLVVLLNIIVMLGYSMIDCVVAGQILSAVSKEGSLDVRVGIVIVSFIAWGITTYGIRMFHFYER